MYNTYIRTLDVTRYLVPLREGGSMPGIVEGEDERLYVLKFRGAGQGKKALIAEFIGGELARHIGLNVPELVFMNLDDSFSRLEPDEEIQDLLKFSVGLNLGLYFLAQAITYDPNVPAVDSLTASKIVLLDSLITNVDRTPKNTNLLNWQEQLYLIDHGASIYFHHNLKSWKDHAQRNFPAIKDHVLLDKASRLDKAKEAIKSQVKEKDIEAIVNLLPDDWLEDDNYSVKERREIYIAFLQTRFNRIDTLHKEASDARDALI